MKELQENLIKQASEELKTLTNIFVEWGQSLYQGELNLRPYTTYELAVRTGNTMEVIGRVPHEGKENINDDFSLCHLTETVLEKYRNE